LVSRLRVVSLVNMSQDWEFGPKMQVLNERQRQFVLELVADPLLSNAEAARIAGYSDSSEAAKVTAHRLMHDQRIIEALHEQAGKRLRSVSLKAAHRVEAMLDSEDDKIALKAAVAILDRVGFGAQQNININQTVTDQSGKAIMDRIRALATKLGLDEQRLLSGPGEAVVDAEFSEVSDD
jgi:phage terminase small subunit